MRCKKAGNIEAVSWLRYFRLSLYEDMQPLLNILRTQEWRRTNRIVGSEVEDYKEGQTMDI